MKPNELKQLHEKLLQDGGNILIIQTAFLGDVILLTPLIGAIKEAYPACKISVITNYTWADVISNLVDQVIPLDKRSIAKDPEMWKKLIHTVREEKFDLAFIPHRSFRSGWLAKQAGIKHRIGFNKGGGRYLHSHKVEYPRMEYEGSRNLRLLEQLTNKHFRIKPFLKPSQKDREFINSIMSQRNIDSKRYIVMAPGSVWHTKRWSESYYRSFIDIVLDIHDIDVILIGGKDDRELCERIATDSDHNFAGELTPLQSCELIGNSEFVLSGDSAPAHMATAMNQKQVIILGSTSPRFGFVGADENIRCAGLDLWCRPCTNHGRNSCPLIRGNLRCMTDILPTDIYNLVKDWLQ